MCAKSRQELSRDPEGHVFRMVIPLFKTRYEVQSRLREFSEQRFPHAGRYSSTNFEISPPPMSDSLLSYDLQQFINNFPPQLLFDSILTTATDHNVSTINGHKISGNASTVGD